MRIPGPTGLFRIDGQPVGPDAAQVSWTDSGLLAGLGLFETLAVRDGRALEIEAHLDRMERGAVALGLELRERAWLARELVDAAAALDAARGWLKLVVTAGGRVAVLADRLEPDDQAGRPASAVLLPWRRSLHDPLSGFKTLNWGANLLGQAEARRRGADEGLWLNARGHLAEGSTSNLFVVRGRRLCTPGDREGILPGVMRGTVLRAAADLGITVQIGKLRLQRLEQAREAFLTSSVRGVRPLVRFENRPVGRGVPGPLTRRIMAEVERREAAAVRVAAGVAAGGRSEP